MSHVSVKQLAMMACLGICSLAAPPAQAEPVVQVIPVNISFFSPCANGGAGEDVQLFGDMLEVLGFMSDNAGGFHVKVHLNYQGVNGVGTTTGLKYQPTDTTNAERNVDIHIGEEVSFVNTLTIIGQGPNNSFLLHETFHFTINADGTMTTFFDNFSAECK